MNSTLKTALPIGLVVLMVFGITFMSQFTPQSGPVAEQNEVETIPPLIVGSAEILYDPSPGAPAHHRFFPGNFEVGTGDSVNRVGFIIRNARPESVFLAALTPSCTLCTSARAAAIPAPELKNYFQHVSAGSLFLTTGGMDLVSAVAWAETHPKLKWHTFAFNDTRNKFELPGATAEYGESWGIIELGFKMANVGAPLPKYAAFDLYDANNNKLSAQPFPFSVTVGGRAPQEINTSEVSIPELSETVSEHPFEVFCLSTTRQILPMPVVSVGGNDPHVMIAKPVPMNEVELERFSLSASSLPGPEGRPTTVNFLSGYRITGFVKRDANGKSIDLGPYQKEIYIGGGPGVVLEKPSRVQLTGNVVGAIRLERTDKIEFGSYDGNFLQKKEIRLWTERKNMDLEVVTELCDPSFLKPSLSAPSQEADRTYWTLNVQIPAREGRRPPWQGFIYLRSKGDKSLTIRIQVSGHGR